MERLSGIASKVRHSASVGGGGDQPVNTTHIALFHLDGRVVRAKSGQPHLIDEGDQVVAVGTASGAVFHALAYSNVSNGVSGDEGCMGRLLVGTALLMFAGYVWLGPGFRPHGALRMVFSLGFAAISLGMVFNGLRTLQAVRQLHAGEADR